MWIDDQILKQCHLPTALEVWVPKQPLVVLGNSNQEATELHSERCRQDRVEILKRYGGGGAVVLYPGCLVVSLGMWVKRLFENDFYFKALNQAMLSTVQNAAVQPLALTQNGISDLCVGPKKFGGTSMFRSKNYLLYQASLLVDVDFDLIDAYLKHPSKEPGYRQERSHRDFLTGLSTEHSSFSVTTLENYFSTNLLNAVNEQLAGELIEPQANHFANIAARLKRANTPAPST